MVLGKNMAIFLLGMGPKFGPWRRAENPLQLLVIPAFSLETRPNSALDLLRRYTSTRNVTDAHTG